MNRVIDFSDPREKALYLAHVRTLDGRWRVEETRYRPRRSDRQNKYYWPCFVEPFADWLSETWGVPVSPEMAHATLKAKLLIGKIVNHETGECMEYVRSTASLDTAEFNMYLDRVADFLADYCGIQVPPADTYREPVGAA